LTQLIFVRHGQTNGNLEGRWQGWSDTPLNEVGRRQAELVAKRLEELRGQVHALYSSPLSRAYQTAQAIADRLALPVRLVTDLREFHFGVIEGMTTAEIEAQYPDLLVRWRDRDDLTFAYPGGESKIGFARRIAETLDLIVARHPEETVIVVSHGGPLRAMLSHYFPEERKVWQGFTPGNCSVTIVNINGNGPQLVTVDDQTHLEELEAALTYSYR
jgi:probable phosphoglycerate mutase